MCWVSLPKRSFPCTKYVLHVYTGGTPSSNKGLGRSRQRLPIQKVIKKNVSEFLLYFINLIDSPKISITIYLLVQNSFDSNIFKPV